MTTPRSTLLLVDLEGLPPDWATNQAPALPCLAGLLEQGAWGAWQAADADTGAPAWLAWRGGGLGRELARAGLGVGLFNLPGTWPPPALTGWVVPRLEAAGPASAATHPPELSLDLADYLAGQTDLLRRPKPRPHQRDDAFAQWACLARLVWEHADRLLSADPPAVAGVGFQGIGEVCALFPDDFGRVALLLAQVDHYLAQLIDLLAPRAVLGLAGVGGFWAWAPGIVPPGQVRNARPGDLAGLALRILHLDIPGDFAISPLPGPWPPEQHAPLAR